MGFIKNLFKQPDVTVQAAPTPAPAHAPAASAPTESASTGVETTGSQLRRRAAGKRALKINSTDSRSSGGTGLSI